MSKAQFIDAIQFLRTVSLRKVFNAFLLRFSYQISSFFGIYTHWGKPESLSVEPTNLCNLKCPECPSGNNSMTRNRLFLSEESYKSTIEEFGPWLSNLILYFQGEPFLHPKIYDFISVATQNNIYTSTSTNGQFLTINNCEKMVQSGLKRIIVSIDGSDQKTFEKYRVGGSLDASIQGIKNLTKAKKELNKPYPYIIIQFVIFSTNAHQIPQIKKLAKNLEVDLLLKTAQIEDFKMGNSLIPIQDKYSRYSKDKKGSYHLKRKGTFKCRRVWQGSVVTADSQLLPCCFDKNAEHSFGKPSKANWKSNSAQDFRKLVWAKNEIAMCKNCSEGVRPITI